MRDLRPWLFLGLGLFLAGLTGLALYGIATETASRRAVEPAPTVDVVVARGDIKPRTVVVAEMLTRRAYPRELVPREAIVDTADAVGQTTVAPIPEGAAVLRPQLASAGGRTGASLTLEYGKVLVAFPTADPLTAAGLVKVGDRVDILATITSGGGESAKKTQMIVQNLEVIDVLGRSQEPLTGREARPSALVFIVDHQDALVLKFLRDSLATTDVVVRSQDQTDSTSTISVDQAYVMQAYGIRR